MILILTSSGWNNTEQTAVPTIPWAFCSYRKAVKNHNTAESNGRHVQYELIATFQAIVMSSSSFNSPKSYLYAHNLKNSKAAILRYVIPIRSISILYHKRPKSPVFLQATVLSLVLNINVKLSRWYSYWFCQMFNEIGIHLFQRVWLFCKYFSQPSLHIAVHFKTEWKIDLKNSCNLF